MLKTVFPDRPNVTVISVAFLANGDSSYRDAANIKKLTREKWNAQTFILTDNTSRFKEKEDVIEIKDKNMFLNTLESIVKEKSRNTDILFCISSHGYSTPDKSERDGKSEYIRVNGQMIMDNEIRDSFYKNMDDFCFSLCLVDTCHSGTMLDLPWVSTNGKSFVQNDVQMDSKLYSFCISACDDSELAGEDISEVGGWGGKLICQFLDYLNVNKKINIQQFYFQVYKVFLSQHSQSSHPIISYF